MRYLAFLVLTWAAFDWPAFVLDRAGVALGGVGLLALALPARRVRVLAEPFPAGDVADPALPGELDTLIAGVRERIEAQTRTGAPSA